MKVKKRKGGMTYLNKSPPTTKGKQTKTCWRSVLFVEQRLQVGGMRVG